MKILCGEHEGTALVSCISLAVLHSVILSRFGVIM